MQDPRTIADYFSRVLRRGQLESVVFEKASTFVAVPRTELLTGAIAPQEALTLFESHDRNSGRSGSADQDKPLPVVISLLSTEYKESGHSGLLLLAAQLHRDGRLLPQFDQGTSPWIPADRLVSETSEGLEVMAGPQEKFWHYLRTEANAAISQVESFADAVGMADKLFAKVSGLAPEHFALQRQAEGFDVDTEYCYIQEHERFTALKPLLDLYDFLSVQESLPPLLRSAATGWQGERRSELAIHEAGGLYRSAKESCGSMGNDNPLTDSQRRAVHAFLGSGRGDVTAISGPPGTGKTTMLQAIVANMITRRALEKAAPPVIVGASTNNQAVTNIIKSFASVAKDKPGILDYRWLPQEQDGLALAGSTLGSLAVYCPAAGKLKEAKGQYLVEQLNKGETYAAYSGEVYRAGARDHFVYSAQRYFGAPNDIAGLCDWIHDALSELDYERIRLLQVMASQGPSEEFQRVCESVESSRFGRLIEGIDELKASQNLQELDEKLDLTLRYAQFWLAVHYFEAQWLLAEDLLDAEDRKKNTRRVMDSYWRQAAALTPCFVMTLYQMPKYFKLYIKPGEPYRFDLERADLLIIDEAGQVDTPLGLPALALAQRAVVVGDSKQISPVWNIDELSDEEVAASAGIDTPGWWGDLRERGLTCSAPSSLMKAASHASKWEYGDGHPGLFLSEHFRCHPQIIGFCNELLYDGLLVPRRRADNSPLEGAEPAFQWHDVPGSFDSPAGSSRQNEAEAKAIARWIVENYARYAKIYNPRHPSPNKKPAGDELIGVVTPFSAQARLIEREIARAARQADDFLGIPPDLASKITVGTAHRLQGAERPIVLFSATYGQNSGQAGFIDANHELLNVAVSRAKDLFVVFAAPNRWNNGQAFEAMGRHADRIPKDPPEETAGPALEVREPVMAEPAPAPPTPEIDEESPPSRTLTATALLNCWRRAGQLREEDTQLKAQRMNERLRDAGVLAGRPGEWQLTALARLLGAGTVERHDARTGDAYESLEYGPRMQALLLELYLEGKL